VLKKRFNASLRLKSFGLGLVIMCVSTLTSALIISHDEFEQWNRFLHDKAYSLASYIADISQEDILDRNYIHLDNIVNKINNDPDIICAVIYDKHGKLLTSLFASLNLKNPDVKKVVSQASAGTRLSDILTHIRKSVLSYEIAVPVVMGREFLGDVVITLSQDKVHEGIQRTLNSVILGNIFLLLTALFLLLRFQNVIIKPVLDLVRVMTSVSLKGDYTLRADVHSRDELGLLAGGFNEMLDQIQHHREHLEDEVAKRTAELMFKNVILSSQMETAIDGILIVDENEKIILFNRRFEDMWEIPHQLVELRDDKPVLQTVAKRVADPEGFLKKVRYLYENRNEKSIDEFLLVDGRVFERYTSSMFDSGGSYYGRVWYFHDITQRRHAEMELKKAYDDLKEVQGHLVQSEKMASIGQLAAGVAHEINNPIGFISNNMEMLEQYVGEYTKLLRMVDNLRKCIEAGDMPKAKSIVKEMAQFEQEIDLDNTINDVDRLLRHTQGGIERVKKIVMDLRTFAREGSDMMDLVQVEEIIDSGLSIVYNELKYKAELKKNYGSTPLVYCNPQRLGQVFINLLVNAAQAIEKKGTIEIKTYNQGQYVCVDITDTGKGIGPENLKKIFDPFFTTKPVGQGTGLGLSVSYEIVKKHGGDIKVQSEVGKGTTFTIMLPVKEGT